MDEQPTGHGPSPTASGGQAAQRALPPSLEREASDLILEAFSRARRSGKPDWRQMTTAVLKNRLLQITSGGFDLRRYDASGMRELVNRLPRLLTYADPSEPGQPGSVSLRPGHLEDDGEPPAHTSLRSRTSIRPDLWRAVMDWTEHAAYVIDPATGNARRRVPEDADTTPTITGIPKETYLSWRTTFIDEALSRDLSDEERVSLERWRDNGGPSRALPRHLQDGWMSLLRARVHAHLVAWYEAQGIPIPADLSDDSDGSSPRTAPVLSVEVAVSVARLRETIQRCVREMTYEELRRLDLPAEVVARVIGR